MSRTTLLSGHSIREVDRETYVRERELALRPDELVAGEDYYARIFPIIPGRIAGFATDRHFTLAEEVEITNKKKRQSLGHYAREYVSVALLPVDSQGDAGGTAVERLMDQNGILIMRNVLNLPQLFGLDTGYLLRKPHRSGTSQQEQPNPVHPLEIPRPRVISPVTATAFLR